MYRYEAIKNIKIKSKGYVSITELFCKTLIKNSKFIEFPCQLNVRLYGSSKIQFTATVLNHIKFIIQLIRLRIRYKN